MRHLIKNIVLVVVSYSLALSAPVSAKSVDNFTAVKNYVNGGGKKTLKGMIEKMESDLPTSFYDQAMKKARGADGKRWYQAAKLANNYIYLRFNNSKVFVRVTEDKGQTVFYANGIKITENDFRSTKNIQNKLFLAYVAGLPAKKSSMFDLFKIKDVFAGTGENANNGEVAQGTGTEGAPIENNQCTNIAASIASSIQEGNVELARQQCSTQQAIDCNLQSACNNGDAAAAAGGDDDNKLGLFLFAAAAILILFLAMRNKKKKNDVTPEVPEDENGVGRTPPTGGGVNCGGDGAQCPGTGTPTPVPVPGTYNPGTPTPPPTGGVPVSNDPNYYGMPVNGTERPQGAPVGNPVFKTRGR